MVASGGAAAPAAAQRSAAAGAAAGASAQQQGDLVKPRCDDLSYRIISLPNRLRAVLVSDPDTDKAAAAMDVRAGSLLDPPELQGLAHFLEHMLFYASEKYPLEYEYSKFISDRGGHTNAFTAAEDTNYQFDVNADSLPEALDRFAQFFICPLISADGVEREIKAVDSEHGKNLNADAWRQHQLGKHTANQDHPYAKFFTGNLDTLMTAPTAAGVDVRARVAAFHREHYSANIMRLAVYGKESLDELEAMVRDQFGAIPNHDLPVPTFPEDVFLPDHLGCLLRVVPVREGHVLQLDWDIPPTDQLYKQAPSNYLAHLLGHEGEGSAFALLKAKGWASGLSAGESGNSISSRGFFYVRIDLTDAGHAHAKEVVGVIFDYLRLLRGPKGVTREAWDELRALQELRFNYRDKLPPYSYVTSLSMGLQHYEDSHLLLGIYNVPTDYDPACIRDLLDHLTPSRLRLYWASKDWAAEATAAPASAPAPLTAATTATADGGAVAAAEPPATAAAADVVAEAEAAAGECVDASTCPTAAVGAAGAAAAAAAAARAADAEFGTGPWDSEPIYGTRYCLEKLPAAWVAAWDAPSPAAAVDSPAGASGAAAVAKKAGGSSGFRGAKESSSAKDKAQRPALHMPDPNPFIPTDFALHGPKDAVSGAPAAPVLVKGGGLTDAEGLTGSLTEGRLRLFHRTELRFKAPKAVVYLDFQSPEAYASPEASVLTRLAVKLLSHELNEVTYPAELAGLAFSASNTLTGFQIVASGYNHKLPTLVATLVERLAALKVDPARFATVREALQREYKNVRYGQPYQWALYRLDMLLHHRRWRVESYEDVISDQGMGPDLLTGHLTRLMARMFTEAMVVGNMGEAEARAVAEGAVGALQRSWGATSLWPGQEKDLRVIKVPGGVTSVLCEEGPNPKDDNSAVALLYQVGPDDLRSNALAALLVQLGKRDAFNVLRTQEQLGYVVSMFLSQEQGVHGIALVLQNDKHTAAHLAARAEAFVRQLVTRLENISEEEFTSGVEELAKAKLEKPKRLGELAQRWWGEVYRGSLMFDRQDREVNALRALRRSDLGAFAKRVLAPGPGRRKLVVLVRGAAERGGDSAAAAAAGEVASAGDGGAASAGVVGTAAAGAAEEQQQQQRAAALAALGEGERLSLIADAAAFKRRCELFAASAPVGEKEEGGEAGAAVAAV